MKMNEIIKTIHSLRSVRGFSEKRITDSDLQTILKSSVRAANAGGRQSYSIIVVEDETIISKYFYKANKALIVCVDFNRLLDTAKRLNHSYDTGGILEFITGTTDAILVAQTAVIAAKSLGIDSLLTNSLHRENPETVYNLFNLPDKYCFPLIGICLGYSSGDPKYKKGRLEGKGIVYYGKYNKLSSEELDEVIAEYDDKDKHIGFSVDWEEKGFTHYLDKYFTNRLEWYPEEIESMTPNIYTILKRIDFLR